MGRPRILTPENTGLTAEELEEIREFWRERQRERAAKQTKDERRKASARAALKAARREKSLSESET